MTAPLSQDLRKLLVRAVEEGASAREAAARFAVSASAAIKLVRRVRQTGSTAPAKIGGYRKPLLAGQEAFLLEQHATPVVQAQEVDGVSVKSRWPAPILRDGRGDVWHGTGLASVGVVDRMGNVLDGMSREAADWAAGKDRQKLRAG